MWVWAIAVLVAVVVSGCGWFGGDDGFTFVAADEVGADPFTADVAEPVPVEFVEVTDELNTAADDAEQEVIANVPPPSEGGEESGVDPLQVAQARQEAVITTAEQRGLSVIAPASPVGVGLFGGSGVYACDVEGLKGFLAAEPGKAAEFARVHGIDPDGIDGYLDGLTAGFLLADTDVTNHAFTNDRAEPFLASLEAGTAVLVDTDAIPRVRCKCGNPLVPAPELDRFANRVVRSNFSRESQPPYNNATEALGPPDSTADTGYVSLGNSSRKCEFYLDVGFSRIAFRDDSGTDLRIYEAPLPEPIDVFVSADADQWFEVGRVGGGQGDIDIGMAPHQSYRFVRLCDAAGYTSAPYPGADIDAVEALHVSPIEP